MPFAYYEKLTARRKRIYRDSDRLEKVDIDRSVVDSTLGLVEELERALTSGSRPATRTAAQALMDRLTAALGVEPIHVEVHDRRPSWATGELHGLYEPDEGRRDRISVWMRTAQRGQLVKFKTFLRTLIHELCHHLDYERFALEESFHTEGFYKRESSLVRQLYPPR